ncbi:MAG: hypothetical protein IJS45_01505 [Clostridia bacterium]|nr:hypothetical protein [Clostridia bacterium]
MSRRIVILFIIIALLSVFFCACKNEEENDTGTVTDSETEPDVSDWDKATLIWVSNTDISFELRVKPGFEYDLKPNEDNSGCTFTESDGKSVDLIVQGLDYEASFDQMILYLKSLDPEKLSAGKESKTIIAVYNAGETEIILKISDVRCLTAKAVDAETAEEFFSNVMIRVNGEDYLPPVLSEEFVAEELY